MPIYEYLCSECGKRFEHFWRTAQAAHQSRDAGESPPCPACHAAHAQRQVAQVAGTSQGTAPEGGVESAPDKPSYTPKEQIDAFQANRRRKRLES